MGAWRGEDTRHQVVEFLRRFRDKLGVVRVDCIGIGHNFALHLRDQRLPVELINVALPCESKQHLGVNDPAQRFVNQKASFYQELADALERDQVVGLTDEETIAQLSGILYEISQGRMKIESKEKARERGVPSPDRADALMLALCKAPPEYAYIPVRDYRRNRFTEEGSEKAEHPYFGFTELGDDDGSDDLSDSRSWRYSRLGLAKW
jgi:hypothetical protein